MLIDQGMNPSFNYSESSSDGVPGIEDEQDFDSMREVAELLKRVENDDPIHRDDNGDEIIDIPSEDELPPGDVVSDAEPTDEEMWLFWEGIFPNIPSRCFRLTTTTLTDVVFCYTRCMLSFR